MPIFIIPIAKCLDCKYCWRHDRIYGLEGTECIKCKSTNVDWFFTEELRDYYPEELERKT